MRSNGLGTGRTDRDADCDMMTRRTLLKLVALLPLVGPAVAKALTQSASAVPRVYGPYLPASFPKWNAAVDGLEDAARWALSIERGWLPPGLAFPREGQVWEAIRDFAIPVWACKHAVKREKVSIKTGERVRVVHVDGPKPVFVRFVRVEEGMVVPSDESSWGDLLCGGALRLKTIRTIADSIQKGEPRVFFMEAFRLVPGQT
jgi:hypothetical protein